VTAAHRRGSPPDDLASVAADLVDLASVTRLLDETRPDAVLHAAAMGRSDDCAARPGDAERANAVLPGLLAGECRERRLRLVALSTDLVFDGARSFVTESDPAQALGVYGRSKRAGEQAVLAAFPGAAVARVALVLGRGHGPRTTSSESILRALRSARPITLYTDEHRTPVDPESLAEALARLLAGRQAGLYHLGGPERLSRYELGRRVAIAFGLPEDGLVPGTQASHAGTERRAPDVSLDSSRARRELGWQPRPLDVAIRESRDENAADGRRNEPLTE
jgi:dTDP-4-dehydrorhamnose reductase